MESRRKSRGKGSHGRSKTKMVTWFDIYSDFKKAHPDLSSKAPDFQPYGYATIKLYFTDGQRMLYNYDTKTLTPEG